MRLSKGVITALKSTKPDEVFWDDTLPGFGCRVRNGKKSWIIQYRVGKQQRRESLGDVRRVSLDDARSIARKRFAQIELGVDPSADRAAAKAKAAAAQVTLGFLCARYLDGRRGIVRDGSLRDMTRYFNVGWKPLANRPIDTLKRADIAVELQNITKASGRVAAARARSYLSAAFAWGMREALCDSNPVIGSNVPDKDIQPRDRVLDIAELAVIWRAAGHDDFGRIVKLLILVPCRRQEVGSLLWSDVNFETSTMTIPGARTKNKNALELVLPDKAIEILESTPRRGDHIFGAKGTGFKSWSIATAALRRRITVPMAQWSLHDLRRSTATHLAEIIGTEPHIIEEILNHSSYKAGVAATYNRAVYRAPKVAALVAWCDHILAAVEGREPKVVAMHERQAAS